MYDIFDLVLSRLRFRPAAAPGSGLNYMPAPLRANSLCQLQKSYGTARCKKQIVGADIGSDLEFEEK